MADDGAIRHIPINNRAIPKAHYALASFTLQGAMHEPATALFRKCALFELRANSRRQNDDDFDGAIDGFSRNTNIRG